KMERIMDRRRLLSAGIWAIAASSRLGSAWAQTAAGSGFSEGYAVGDGARLYFVRSGEGPLMLFLHGHPDSWALYEPQLKEFSRDHLVVAPNSGAIRRRMRPTELKPMRCRASSETCMVCSITWVENAASWLAMTGAAMSPGCLPRLTPDASVVPLWY